MPVCLWEGQSNLSRAAQKDFNRDPLRLSSLPINVDHFELARLLQEHLSPLTEVKNVKVIRDNKGGTCAFVQCEVNSIPS